MMTTQTSPTSAIVARAAEWAALFDDPPVSEQAQTDFARWCRADPLHRQTFDRMMQASSGFETLDSVEARAISRIAHRASAARRVASGLACMFVVAGLGLALSHSYAVQALWPDHRTAVGELKTVTMADGSALVADTGTRFDTYDEDARERRIRLFDGQILATVAHAPGRPFVVETREGTATALGTVYTVKRQDERSIVTVIQSRVRLCPTQGGCRTLGAGERAAMTASRIEPLSPVDPEVAGLWATGWIEVDDRPLPEVIAELSRYRAALVRFDAQALAGLRVTGSYPVKDPDAAFRSIASATGLSLTVAADGTMELARAGR